MSATGQHEFEREPQMGLPGVAGSATRASLAESRLKWDAFGLPAGGKMVAAVALIAAANKIVSAIDARLRATGITRPRASVLALLYFSRRRSLPLSRISDALMVHPTTITSLVDRLERDGLVQRLAAPDRRVTLAAITPLGIATYEKCLPIMIEFDHGLAALTDDEAEHLLELLQRTIDTSP